MNSMQRVESYEFTLLFAFQLTVNGFTQKVITMQIYNQYIQTDMFGNNMLHMSTNKPS